MLAKPADGCHHWSRKEGTVTTSTPRRDLHFGERFRIRSHRGKLYVLTFLKWADADDGLYVRLGNRDIARLDSSRVEWSTWAAASDSGEPPVGDGDDVLVVTQGGELRGQLLDLGATIRLRLKDGEEARIRRDDVKELYLLFRARSLKAGDEFMAKTKHGTDLRGRVATLDEAGMAAVDLADGSRAYIAPASLDASTLTVLISVPLHDLVSTRAGFEEETLLLDNRGMARTADQLFELRDEAEGSDGDLFLCCNALSPIELARGKPIVVGRSLKQADLVLPHKGVSRQHAEFVRKADGLYVRDLGTVNGTFVGAKRLGRDPVRLAAGESVRIEVFHLCVKDSSGE